MKIATFLALLFFSTVPASAGPYSPAAGQPHSDAIGVHDPRIQEWASGYQNYIQGNPINSLYTDPTKALGPAQGTTFDVTELGDGGQITLTFPHPIVASASGPDFAVFGNALDASYLKLAYVEVSQDGQNWELFPNYSLTPSPVPTYGNNMDPTNIYGLAGKYMRGYAVPFSLSEVGLASASFVRLVDVVGDGSNKDTAGNQIYDPYPNDNGFNVGGVGVLSMAPEPASALLMLLGAGLLAIGRKMRAVLFAARRGR